MILVLMLRRLLLLTRLPVRFIGSDDVDEGVSRLWRGCSASEGWNKHTGGNEGMVYKEAEREMAGESVSYLRLGGLPCSKWEGS